MEYYSAIKKNPGNPVTCNKRMNLEGIMLREVIQRKTNTVRYMWNLKKPDSWKLREELQLPRTGRWWGEWGTVGQMVQASSQNMNKFWRSEMLNCDYSNNILHT